MLELCDELAWDTEAAEVEKGKQKLRGLIFNLANISLLLKLDLLRVKSHILIMMVSQKTPYGYLYISLNLSKTHFIYHKNHEKDFRGTILSQVDGQQCIVFSKPYSLESHASVLNLILHLIALLFS